MTPAQWTMFAIAFVIAAPTIVVLMLALCRAAGEADDDADEYAERFLWSHK